MTEPASPTMPSIPSLSYYNGQSYTFTWENGCQLASAVTGGKTVTFKYNADGIRTEKHLSGTHDIYYRLLGDKVVEMKKLSENGTERYVFIYDESGAPYAIEYYNGYSGSMSKYYYILNVQGDVIQIVDSENNVVANYTYDAWGVLYVKSGSHDKKCSRLVLCFIFFVYCRPTIDI